MSCSFLATLKEIAFGTLANLVVGAIASLFVALAYVVTQFHFSNAGFRINSVADATREFDGLKKIADEETRKKLRSGLRNKYRYSLGVFLDELYKSFRSSDKFKENGPWPMVIDSGEQIDRWGRYDRYVRPIINDINSYAFLGFIPTFDWVPHFRKLKKLFELCNALESVVAEIDSAMGKDLVKSSEDDEIELVNANDENIGKLKDSYMNLYKKWNEWIKITVK